MYGSLLQDIQRLAVIDCHTHLDARHPSARGLHDVMFYHMVISELYSAGCPSGARLSEEPTEQEKVSRITEAIPYLKYVENTSCYFLLRIILQDLYDWNDPVTLNNWQELDERIAAKSADPK